MRSIKRIRLALTLCLVASVMPLRAQIPADVKPILDKVEEWFDDKEGIDVNMTGKVLTAKVTTRSRTKGDKALVSMSITMMGKTLEMQIGCDGKQTWTYDPQEGTLTIEKDTELKKNDNSVDLKLVSEYKKAKMKTTDNAYEITLTEPKDKENPSKMVLTARRSDCRPMEMTMGSGLKKLTFTIVSIKKGVPDNVFVLDTSKYPNVKIVKK